jgi:hypothetical protein
MTFHRVRRFAAAALAVLAAAAARADDFSAALGPVFQADLPQTLARLKALPDESLSAKARPARACILARFALADPASAATDARLPPDLAAVLRAYRRYWTSVLMHARSAADAEAALSDDLGRLLPEAPPGLEARTKAAVAFAETRGWHALGGLTAPLQEFVLWKDEATRREDVALPGGTVAVKVSMLDGFASLGWGAWGTCDLAHTGGWATSDGLMVVVPGWDLSSERYRISLLAHESQHFADYPRFPKLAQTDLEYRAKLVELALAHDAQHELLAMFAAGAKRDRTLPHPFAQWWVMQRIGERLGTADWQAWKPGEVRAAAAAELAAHGALLQARGASTVATVLPD